MEKLQAGEWPCLIWVEERSFWQLYGEQIGGRNEGQEGQLGGCCPSKRQKTRIQVVVVEWRERHGQAGEPEGRIGRTELASSPGPGLCQLGTQFPVHRGALCPTVRNLRVAFLTWGQQMVGL